MLPEAAGSELPQLHNDLQPCGDTENHDAPAAELGQSSPNSGPTPAAASAPTEVHDEVGNSTRHASGAAAALGIDGPLGDAIALAVQNFLNGSEVDADADTDERSAEKQSDSTSAECMTDSGLVNTPPRRSQILSPDQTGALHDSTSRGGAQGMCHTDKDGDNLFAYGSRHHLDEQEREVRQQDPAELAAKATQAMVSAAAMSRRQQQWTPSPAMGQWEMPSQTQGLASPWPSLPPFPVPPSSASPGAGLAPQQSMAQALAGTATSSIAQLLQLVAQDVYTCGAPGGLGALAADEIAAYYTQSLNCMQNMSATEAAAAQAYAYHMAAAQQAALQLQASLAARSATAWGSTLSPPCDMSGFMQSPESHPPPPPPPEPPVLDNLNVTGADLSPSVDASQYQPFRGVVAYPPVELDDLTDLSSLGPAVDDRSSPTSAVQSSHPSIGPVPTMPKSQNGAGTGGTGETVVVISEFPEIGGCAEVISDTPGPAANESDDASNIMPDGAESFETILEEFTVIFRDRELPPRLADDEQLLRRRQSSLRSCIESLYRDRLEPSLAEVQQRLNENSWQRDEVAAVLPLCARCPDLYRLVPPYGSTPARIFLREPPAWFESWVGPDTDMEYPKEVWEAFSRFLEDDNVILDGGVRGAALEIRRRALPGLRHLGLGELRHLVEVAASRKGLLTYVGNRLYPRRSHSMRQSPMVAVHRRIRRRLRSR